MIAHLIERLLKTNLFAWALILTALGAICDTLAAYIYPTVMLSAGGMLVGIAIMFLLLNIVVKRHTEELRRYCHWERFAGVNSSENALALSRHTKHCRSIKAPGDPDRGDCNCDQSNHSNAIVQCRIDGGGTGGVIDLGTLPDDIQVVIAGIHILPHGTVLIRKKPAPGRPYDRPAGIIAAPMWNTHIDHETVTASPTWGRSFISSSSSHTRRTPETTQRRK